jgi:hypothetical protein
MASAWRERLGLLAAALWWGSLTAVGAWVVPLLFVHLPSAAMAGSTAARLFTAQTWVALACGLVLLMALRPPDTDRLSPQAQRRLAWVVAGMGLALLMEFVVAPRIVARQDLRLWHTVGTAMYALQWVCAGLTLWRQVPAGTLSPESAS